MALFCKDKGIQGMELPAFWSYAKGLGLLPAPSPKVTPPPDGIISVIKFTKGSVQLLILSQFIGESINRTHLLLTPPYTHPVAQIKPAEPGIYQVFL